MTPPTGTLRLPVTPATSTVLGQIVTEDDVMWRGLDWTDVRADHGLFFLPEPETVLNPTWTHPEDKPHLPDGVRYRVRCRHEIGRRLHVGRRYAYVVSVEAEQVDGAWWWVIGYGPAAPPPATESAGTGLLRAVGGTGANDRLHDRLRR